MNTAICFAEETLICDEDEESATISLELSGNTTLPVDVMVTIAEDSDHAGED